MNGTNLIFHLGSALVLGGLLWQALFLRRKLSFLMNLISVHKKIIVDDLVKTLEFSCKCLAIPFVCSGLAKAEGRMTKIKVSDLKILFLELSPLTLEWKSAENGMFSIHIEVSEVTPVKEALAVELGLSWKICVCLKERGGSK